eukprot:9475008-Pyramimonas_sp.AAC.1
MATWAKSFVCEGGIGSFEKLRAPTVTRVDSALTAGKKFISVASTCYLILDTMPKTPKASRLDVLTNHVNKCKNAGLPPNLQEFLNKELSKMKAHQAAKPKGVIE